MYSLLLEIQNVNTIVFSSLHFRGDRVHSETMIFKLRRAWRNDDFLKFFADDLSPRMAVVVADG